MRTRPGPLFAAPTGDPNDWMLKLEAKIMGKLVNSQGDGKGWEFVDGFHKKESEERRSWEGDTPKSNMDWRCIMFHLHWRVVYFDDEDKTPPTVKTVLKDAVNIGQVRGGQFTHRQFIAWALLKENMNKDHPFNAELNGLGQPPS